MSSVMYYTACKICKWWWGGGNLELATKVINRHLIQQHRVLWWSSEGKDIEKFVDELKKTIPHTEDFEGVVEGASVIHDGVEKTWVIVTPLFEIAPTPNFKIKEEEREEAKKMAMEIKERRKIIERESKRKKYKRKYRDYLTKYYGDYLDSKSSHILQNLRTTTDTVEFMQLWCEYHSLRPFVDRLNNEQLERLRKISKEIKKRDVRPPTTFQLLKIELEEYASSP